MEKEIEYSIRLEELLSFYTLEDFEKEIKAFKNKYPDGKYFNVHTYTFDENKSFICLQCESPETKKEKRKREKEDEEKKKERYQQYLKLKAEFEGEPK